MRWVGTHRWGGHSPTATPVGSWDSPFWVSFVEQTSVEIWKLSRADTVKPDAAPLTRKEEPERSFGSERFLVEGRVRYTPASSSLLLSPCKQSLAHTGHHSPAGAPWDRAGPWTHQVPAWGALLRAAGQGEEGSRAVHR